MSQKLMSQKLKLQKKTLHKMLKRWRRRKYGYQNLLVFYSMVYNLDQIEIPLPDEIMQHPPSSLPDFEIDSYYLNSSIIGEL